MTIYTLDPRKKYDHNIKNIIYNGDFIIFHQPSNISHFISRAQQLIENEFGPNPQKNAHQFLDFNEKADKLRKTAKKDLTLFQYFSNLLTTDLGFNSHQTGLDSITLRIQPPIKCHTKNTLLPHRDTWGSNLMSQINWWFPVYPLNAQCTIWLFPSYWTYPVHNSSDHWDWKKLKYLSEEDKQNENNLLPVSLEEIPSEHALPIVPNVTDLFCFSGAHLHASVPNQTSFTRFSIDTRTIDFQDEKNHHFPKNIDGRAKSSGLSWFTSLE